MGRKRTCGALGCGLGSADLIGGDVKRLEHDWFRVDQAMLKFLSKRAMHVEMPPRQALLPI